MGSQMEKILGGPIGHNNVIPGTVAVGGKEFVYFSDDGKNPFRKQFNALTQHTNPPHAKRGGTTSQGCSIALPDGSVFHAIAYHGDIEGWRHDIREGAQALHVLLARIEGDRIVVSDGRSFSLEECKATFG
jgi:hypothetical protein